jgi:hypothetical protein
MTGICIFGELASCEFAELFTIRSASILESDRLTDGGKRRLADQPLKVRGKRDFREKRTLLFQAFQPLCQYCYRRKRLVIGLTLTIQMFPHTIHFVIT